MAVISRPVISRPSRPAACTLFKGTRKQAVHAGIYYSPWTADDQFRLCKFRSSRQARRFLIRLQFKKLVRGLRSSSTCSHSIHAFNDLLMETLGTTTGPRNNDSDTDSDPPRSGTNRAAATTRLKRGRDEDHSEENARPAKQGRGDPGDNGDDGDDSDGGDNLPKKGKGPPKKDQKKPAGLKRRKTPPGSQQKTDKTVVIDSTWADQVDEIIKSNDIMLKNAKRIAKKLKNVKITNVKPMQPAEQTEYPLQRLLHRPRVSGRDVQPLTRAKKNSTSCWDFSFKEGNNKKKVTKITTLVPYAVLPDNANDHDAQQLHNQLALLYNAWPYELKGIGAIIKTQLVSVAAANLWSSPLQINEAVHGDTLGYRVTVHYIDAKTGAVKSIRPEIKASDMYTSKITVPTLPTINVYSQTTKTTTLLSPDQPHHIAPPTIDQKKLGARTTTSQGSQHKAEDALYWIASRLQGMIASEKRMEELLQMYRGQLGLESATARRSHGPSGGRGHGLYGGRADLFSFHYWRARNQTQVRPTKAIADDLGLKRADLYLSVYSLNAHRAVQVMETILRLFCSGMDIRHVWIEAAKSADEVNQDISSGVPYSATTCDCDEEQANSEMHICEGCAKPVVCKDRSYDSMGRNVCQGCFRSDQTRSVRGQESGESLAAYKVYVSLWRSFRQECAMRQLDPTEAKYKGVFDEAYKLIKLRLPGGGNTNDPSFVRDAEPTYVDEWTCETRKISTTVAAIGNNPFRRRFIPTGITVDAVHRQGHPDNFDLKHSGNNLRITSNACNFAHSVFNPGSMHEIGEFLRKAPDEQQSSTVRKALVDKLTEMAKVSCKRKYINASQGSALAKYEKIIDEATAGKPTPDEDGPWNEEALGYTSRPVRAYDPQNAVESSIWDVDTWFKLNKCAESIERYFGVELPKLRDGTRWIGTADTSPSDFDRNGVAMLCRERIMRMRLKCNVKWWTYDNEARIYCEILFQYCCSKTTDDNLIHLKAKYGDRLGLPLVLFYHTPLRLSVAHRLHGFGMHTGWSSETPEDVQERIDNDVENNMLIESWYVNCAKFDMAEAYYDQLDDCLRKIRVELGVYDSSRIPSASAVVPTQESQDEVDEEGALFDALEDGKAEEDGASGTIEEDTEMSKGDDNVNESGTWHTVTVPNNDAELNRDLAWRFDNAYTDALSFGIQEEADVMQLLGRMQELAQEGTPDHENEFNQCSDELYRVHIGPAGAAAEAEMDIA